MIDIPGLIIKTGTEVDPFVYETDLAPHLRMTADDISHKSYIEDLARSAVHKVEHDTMRALITRIYTQSHDQLPCYRDEIKLLRGPVTSAAFSMKYLNTSGEEITLALNTDVILDTMRNPSSINLPAGKSWERALDQVNSVLIDFTAGYGPAAVNVPKVFKTLIAQLTVSWFENPEAVSTMPLYEIPNPVGYDSLLATVKTWGF